MSNFKKVFYFFFKYWEIVEKRGVEYNSLQVMVATSFIFDIIRIENSGWDIEEFKYLYLAIDASCEESNPNNFIYCQVAYIDEIKNYYKQNNDKKNG